jgi:hypothetical protein
MMKDPMSEQNPEVIHAAGERATAIAALLEEYKASKKKYTDDPLVQAMAAQLAQIVGMTPDAVVEIAHSAPDMAKADQAAADVVGPISGYLRVCRNGGMSKKASDAVLDAVKHAQDLGYFELLRAPATLDGYDRERILHAGRVLQWMADFGTEEPLDEDMVREAGVAVRYLTLVLGISRDDAGAHGLAAAESPAAANGTTALGALAMGWRNAAAAWDVCASIHRTYAKKTDALFSTRQQDFLRHAADARTRVAALPGPLFAPR